MYTFVSFHSSRPNNNTQPAQSQLVDGRLKMDIEGFRKAGYAAVDAICDYYYRIQSNSLPVCAAVEPGFLSSQIPSEAPEEGQEWSLIASDYQDVILPGITHWQSPSFFAYYPCNATFEGGLADLHAAMISNPGFNWTVSPSVTELEIITLDWIAKMLGLSESFWSTSSSGTGGGIILGSASEVALTIAVAAREKALSIMAETEPAPDVSHLDSTSASQALSTWRSNLTSKLVMYGTTQTHSIAAKAALILGLDFRALEVKKEDAYALRGETLESALKEDEAMGRVPFILIASLGTTSSGAVDRLDEIMDVAQSRRTLWIHVDAAWAGVALSLPEVREKMFPDALDQVDSFSTNYHKWGLVQFDCSPLLVRDRTALSNALRVTPEYLRTRQGETGSVLDLRNFQLSLGRRFRSLKVWFVLRSYGLQGFRSHLRKSIKSAERFEERFIGDGNGRFELVTPGVLALRVFRVRPPGKEEIEKFTRRFYEHLSTPEYAAKLLLTQTTLPEVGYCIRFVTGSPWTRDEHIDQAVRVLNACYDDIARDGE